MNLVKDTLRELVERRLWPLAVLLLVAAVAAPMLLKSQPEEPVTPAANAVTSEGAGGISIEPLVAASVDTQGDRRVLGARKDPFRPTGEQPRADSGPSPDPSTSPNPSTSSNPGSGSTGGPPAGDPKGGGFSGGGGSSPLPDGPIGPASPPESTPAPAPAAPETPEPTFDLYSLTVRVDDGERQNLKRLDPLLSLEDPAIIYLGLLEAEKTAVFLLDEGVTADGDGSCHPSPENCQRVHLREGETEFFTRAALEGVGEGGAAAEPVEFQLEVLDIKTKKTASAGTARAARAAASTSGRRALRSRVSRMGRLRYDLRTGKLHQLSVKAYRSSMARASRRRAGLARGSNAEASRSGGGLFARASGRRAGLGTP
jgi:hypothetical protein